jgi:hypothetical protein
MYVCRFDRLTGGLDIVAADQFFLSHCHSGNYHLCLCSYRFHTSSVVDPDPDPAFQVNPDTDAIWIQGFDDQKMK